MAPSGSSWHSFHPLVTINDPADVWADNPSFLVAEALFLGLLLWVTLYATSKGGRERALLVACLTAGGSIEILTIMHKQVGNFYHSQATVMLFGQREPLYMVCWRWSFLCMALHLSL
jgi:hypothetical protein